MTHANTMTNFINCTVYLIILLSISSVSTAHIGHISVSAILIAGLYYLNLTDVIYFSGNIFEIADTSNSLLVFVGIAESNILAYRLMSGKVRNKILSALPSVLIIFIYSDYIVSSLK